jgi:hypothetical protein
MKIIRITGENNQVIFKGVIPNRFIRKSIAPIVRKRKFGSIEPSKLRGRFASTKNFIKPLVYLIAEY